MAGRRGGKRLMGEINVVPYIDVMLVLLIIFMVTAPLLTQGVKVELPRAEAEAIDQSQGREPVVLTVDAEGRYYLDVGGDPEEPLDRRTVVARVAAVLKSRPDTQVLVRADESVPYGRVVRAMTWLQDAGAPSVGMVTEGFDDGDGETE